MEALLESIPGISVIRRPEYSDFRTYYGFRFIYDESMTGISRQELIEGLRQDGVPAYEEPYALLP